MPRYTIQDGLQALSDSVSVLNQAKTPDDALKAFPSILAMARLAAKGNTAETTSTPHPVIEQMGQILSNPKKLGYSEDKKIVTQILAAVSEVLKPTSAAKMVSQPFDRPKPSTGKTEAPTVEPSPSKLKPK